MFNSEHASHLCHNLTCINPEHVMAECEVVPLPVEKQDTVYRSSVAQGDICVLLARHVGLECSMRPYSLPLAIHLGLLHIHKSAHYRNSETRRLSRLIRVQIWDVG
jgi:hypothetical protein